MDESGTFWNGSGSGLCGGPTRETDNGRANPRQSTISQRHRLAIR